LIRVGVQTQRPGVRRRAAYGRADADAGPTAAHGAAVLTRCPWPYAVRSIGAEGLPFHDLRHTGNTFAASSGAGLRDLMARMGHDSERAALIYQHEARGADQAITRAIDTHVQAEHANDDDDDGLPGSSLRGLMARKIKESVRMIKPQARHSGPELGLDSWSG
jgi:hypothetical protein